MAGVCVRRLEWRGDGLTDRDWSGVKVLAVHRRLKQRNNCEASMIGVCVCGILVGNTQWLEEEGGGGIRAGGMVNNINMDMRIFMGCIICGGGEVCMGIIA